jgi:hypothetical protein
LSDYNPLNPLDYWQLGYDFWSTTLTEGPQAGLDVLTPHYVEHVVTGAMFIPGAGTLGTAYKVRGGVGGGVSLARTLARPGGRAGLILQQTAKTQVQKRTGIGVMALGRTFSRAMMIETTKLLYDGQYAEAAVSWWGPPGSLLVYERMKGKPGHSTMSPTKQLQVEKTKPKKSGKKPSKMPAAQKKRLWRMGLRWCRSHGRYDRCSSRVRK